MREYLKNRFDGPEGARRQIELLDAQSLRLAAKAEALRIQQAYVSLKSLYWRAIAEGHEDEANRILEENKDVIENVKNSPARARPHAEHSDDDGPLSARNISDDRMNAACGARHEWKGSHVRGTA